MAAPRATRTEISPRRLSQRERRVQLISAAVPLVARHGPAGLSLDEVAERVGVTRNLLYHYFPEGRAALLSAVVDEAERQLLGPCPSEDLAGTVSRVLDHALAPTHAWRIHRMASALPGASPSTAATAQAAVDALARFTGSESSPRAELALHGYVAYAEAVLDRARVAGTPRSGVLSLLAHTLRTVVAPG